MCIYTHNTYVQHVYYVQHSSRFVCSSKLTIFEGYAIIHARDRECCNNIIYYDSGELDRVRISNDKSAYATV